MICMYKGDDYEGQRKGVLLSAAVFLQRSYNDGYKIDENKKTTRSVVDINDLENSPLAVINGYFKAPEKYRFDLDSGKKTIKNLPYKVTGGMLTLGDNQFVFKPVQDETVLKGILEPRDTFLELFVRRG